jgi:hypothetical protein
VVSSSPPKSIPNPAVPPILLRAIIVVSFALVASRLLVAEPLSSANDRSRWCTVYALAHQGGAYEIDEVRKKPGWDTIDLVKKDEHFYSTKPPILAWIVSKLYLVQYHITSALTRGSPWTFDTHLAWVTRLLLLFINLVPMAIAWSLISRWCLRWAETPVSAIVCLLTCTVGSLLTPFLTTFNNHTVGASAVVFTLAAALPIVIDGRREGWRFLLAGLFAAWTICNELPALAFAGLLFLWLLRLAPKQALTWGLLGAAAPLALYFWTNYQATGSWKPFYSAYGQDLYVFTHEGVPSYWSNPKGLDTNRDSWQMYLVHCTVGHHGWFSLTPIFLFSLFAWFPGGLRNHPLRRVIQMGGLVSLIVFLFYMFQPEHYNYGGMSVALRWMLWVIPFWGLALLPALDGFSQARWSRGPALLALGLSTFSAWYPANSPWAPPWIYTLMNRWRWIDYNDPRPPQPRAITSWIYTLPTGARNAEYWAEWQRTDVDGSLRVLRLEDGGPTQIDGRDGRQIRITLDPGTRQVVSQTITVDAAALLSGKPVTQFLLGSTTPDEIRLVQGLPTASNYFVSSIRYVRAPIRTDAFPTLLVYAYGDVTLPDQKSWLRTKRDVWTSEEVPFGVVQMETQTHDPVTGQVYRVERWSLRAAGMLFSPAQSSQPAR